MELTVIRSSRKTVAIQVNSDSRVTVRAPRSASEKDIERIIKKNEAWINKHIEETEERKKRFKAKTTEKLTHKKIAALADKALEVISARVEYFAKIMKVTYGHIAIRNQKTRWGSCSSKGNLNFNCLLMLAPAEVLDYVVVHELCHRKEMNHSKAFWMEVQRILPDYKEAIQWLKEDGSQIIRMAAELERV